jgi:hypothetical protein
MNLYDKAERQTFVERGLEVYDQLAPQLEQQHAGGIVAICPESGEHFVGKTLNQADEQAYKATPDAWYLFVRIGDRSAHLPLQSW